MEEQARYFRWGDYLMRFRFTQDGLYEDRFESTGDWKPTGKLSGPFYKGDTGLVELSEEDARAFCPEAFDG